MKDLRGIVRALGDGRDAESAERVAKILFETRRPCEAAVISDLRPEGVNSEGEQESF